MTDAPRTQADYDALVPGSTEAVAEADRLIEDAKKWDQTFQRGKIAAMHTEAARLRSNRP